MRCKQRGNAHLMTKVKGNIVPGENFCFDGAGASLVPRYPCKSISGSSRDIGVKAEPSSVVSRIVILFLIFSFCLCLAYTLLKRVFSLRNLDV